MFIVYRAKSPSKKIYIGITSKTISHRIAKHYSSSKLGSNTPFHRALRKYPKNTILWSVLRITKSWKRAQRFERKYIKYYNKSNILYNVTLGGEGVLGFRHSESTKRKMSKPKSVLPSKESIQRRLKTKERLRKKKFQETLAFRSRLSNPSLKGQRQAISKDGRFFSIFDSTGKIVWSGICKTHAAKALNLWVNQLNQHLNHPEQRPQIKGYVAKYEELSTCPKT